MKNNDLFLQSVNYWPINLASGPEFLAIYAVIAVVALTVSRLVQLLVLNGLDGQLPQASDGPSDYRTAYRPGASIRIGTLPNPSDLYRVAYLRGGADNVADTLIAQACAQGWLQGFDVVAPAPRDAPPEVHRFHAALLRFQARDAATIRRAAKDLDGRWLEATRDALSAQNLLRSFGKRMTAAIFVLLPMALVVWIGVLRIERGLILGRPVGFLVLLLLVVVGISLWCAFPAKKTTHAERYLAWLDSATSSFRAQATQGAARNEHDWMLAAALGGAAAVPLLALYRPVSSGFAGSASAGSSSCGSSSCGGSSCGGGGCGGGGCGG